MRQPVLLAAIAAMLFAVGPTPRLTADAPAPRSLTAIVTAGLTRDTNGDGLADALAARIIVPAAASIEDLEAATNLAARLGYETTALTLPIVVRDADLRDGASIGVPILVGRDNAVTKKLIASRALDIGTLQPGQGLIQAVASPLGGGDGLVVIGGDDAGTLAAGVELAARLPRAWGMTGITLPAAEEQAVRYLRAHGVSAAEAGTTSVLVDSDRRGIARLSIRIRVPSAGDAARAARVLDDLEQAHRRGLEPRNLDFTNVAATRIELIAAGQLSAHAEVARIGLNQRTLTPPIDPDELAPDSPGDRGRPAETPAAAAAAKTFDLTDAFSIDGWYGDAYTDLIPDRTDTSIVLGDARDAFGAAHVAARLGLETTGIGLPITRTADKVRDPAREPNPILIGQSNALVERLIKIGKARADDLAPGEGTVQIVPKAFGNSTATVIAGADPAGTEAGAMYVARRIPYIWDNRRGSPTLADAAQQLTRFLQARSAAGQASQIETELESIARELKDRDKEKTLESVDAKLFVENADPALEKHVAARLGREVTAPITVASSGITDPVTVFDETIDVPWEVDEFWTKFREAVLPAVKRGSTVDVEARLSEAPEIRKAIADRAREELTKAGAADASVRVLSAYKQGFLWLTEQVAPELKAKGARAVHIKVAEYHPDLSKKYKFYMVPSRWVHELYPVDEIFQRDLGIAREAFTVELVDDPKDTYTLDATDASGRVVYHAAFSPKTVEREYLDKFPGWSRVMVTTGWVTAAVDGKPVVDARIATDPERFWDHYQTKVLPRIYDYVMKTTENRPMPDKQPFHRDLDVEVWMSEPDFRLGIDEELVSSLEALHEDLYFVTLDFFDALGRTTVKRRLAAPGKIFPIIHAARPGQAGQVKVHYAGNASAKPKLEVSYKQKGVDKPTRISRELTKIDATAAVVPRVVARADRVSELELDVEAKDDREAGRAVDALDALVKLHEAGLYRDALSFDHVDRVAVGVHVKEVHARRVIKSTGSFAPSNVRAADGAGANGGRPIVTWDHIISPDESEAIIGRLAAFPEVRAYKAGRSYRGREISVLEITNPAGGEQVSVAKLTAYKPTIFITGRQHANEVSSTSHILRLAELLATDPGYKEILKKVNVILQPVENPDGAQMAYELQKLTPTHMLHAGRYSALGMDVQSQVGVADPLLPEALVRGRLWREWLPDIYLNPHGYPSHEWVQPFAGYVPPGFRTYLSTRGWYTTIGTLRDPRYPNHAEATEAVREAIVREINANPDVRAMDLRHQARYRKWAYGFGPYVFNQEIYKDTAIYYSDPETGEPSGSRRFGASRFGGGGEGGAPGPGGGTGRFSMAAWPQVTFFSGGTEAPDETAQGAWLTLVTKAGFSYLMANIKYLRDGRYDVQRIEEDAARDSVVLTTVRVRPVLPGRSPAAGRPATTTGGGGR